MLSDLRGIVARANRRPALRSAPRPILFVKPGSKTVKKPQTTTKSLLDSANDWEFHIDLDGSFTWPVTDVPTLERPDTVFISRSQRVIIWAELTVPIERRISHSAIIKTQRYSSLKTQLLLKNWTVHDFTFEVGAIGFLGNTVNRLLSALGFPRAQIKLMLKRISKMSLRSSFYIWNARKNLSWNPPILCKASPVAVPSPRKEALDFLSSIKPDLDPISDSIEDDSYNDYALFDIDEELAIEDDIRNSCRS